jgi:pimeloyl-ACP methyl ester carboxylesterase
MRIKANGIAKMVIPSAAHLSNIEQAEVFNREILAFLKAN